MRRDESLPTGSHPGRVSLRVNDLDRASVFYTDVVGLVVEDRESGRPTLGTGERPLLELVEDPDAPKRTEREAGLFHTAFLVPSRKALADALERLDSHWRLTGASDHLVSEALYTRDPEGNGVEIYCDRERSEWPETDDGTPGIDTLPLDLEELRALDAGEETLPRGTRIGHVHLEVSSLDESGAFYADDLGLDVRQAVGDSALFLAVGDYHHHLALNTWNRRSDPPKGRGLASFELVVPDRDTLERIAERVPGDSIASASETALELEDPDGIRVSVTTAGY
ncbi:VOC family protein [Natronorarus salvus]|uniref:VOC family protein n=1 Tax=Natronorarus salvus TaxID=3117733 RepID=UPI002F2682B9